MIAAEQIIVDQIIAAARSSVYRRVLFLGPYARRVSFASQQNRALNLLWALKVKGQLKDVHTIAIIGAGVSGVTLAAATKALGYAVTIYEANDEVLNRQKGARHRYIHPTINRWPEDEIRETTIGPYFDWISDICTAVLKMMKIEWVRVREDISVVAPVEVMSFSEPRDAARVAVKTAQACKENRDRYDMVFVTSGFAEEGAGRVGLATYWSWDELDGMAAKTDEQFLISGAGDGALIDSLRVAHRDFEDGRLTIELAYKLNDAKWGYREIIAAAELEIANSEERIEEAVKLGSESLAEVYLRAARELPAEIALWLTDSLRLQLIDRIELIAMERWPFSPMAAPIHKLLLAHAINNSVISHTRGRVDAYDRQWIRYLPLDENGNEGPPVRREGVVVIRHGSSPNFAKFFKPSEEKAKLRLIDRQKKLAPDADRPMWREGGAPLLQWPPDPPFRDAIKHRLPLADALVHRMVGLVGKLDADENLGFVFDNPSPEILARLPNELFGFPLGPAPDTVARPAGGLTPAADVAADGMGPGKPIIATLNGRAGPIVADVNGTLFLLTAAHVVWSPSEGFAKHVIDSDGLSIGAIENDDLKSTDSLDVARIRINPGVRLSRRYGQFSEFAGLADAKKLFASSVYLIDSTGTEREGYVSASRAPVRYRHAGGEVQIFVPNAVRIRPMDSQAGFAGPGDSGAPVVDAQGRLLGLVLAEDGEYSYVAPLTRYMQEHGLVLATQEQIDNHNLPGTRTKPQSVNRTVKDTLVEMAHFRRLDLAETTVELGPISEELDILQ
ncbi:MAG TPA: trypsin-like peptidase domain-containing protein [Allosphingosinicella sp.]|nr:trypsin-like peptidase domain-containing protein [Allosphingosinicella sp.]